MVNGGSGPSAQAGRIEVWRGDMVRQAIGRSLGPGAIVAGRPGNPSPSWLAGLPFGPDQFFLGSASGALGLDDLPLLLDALLVELPPHVRRIYHYDASWLGGVGRAYIAHGFVDFVHRYSMQRRLPAPAAPQERLALLPLAPEAEPLFARTYAACLIDCQSPMSLEDTADPAAALRFQIGQDHGPDGRRWYLGLLPDGTPAGMALLDRYGPAASDWVVSFLGTTKSARSQGYGRELLLRAAHQATRAGARKLHLAVCQTNEPALGLYRSTGFRTEETYRVFRRQR
jgi:ribosomal protein S18 acetylase RimI-like enzyme